MNVSAKYLDEFEKEQKEREELIKELEEMGEMEAAKSLRENLVNMGPDYIVEGRKNDRE